MIVLPMGNNEVELFEIVARGISPSITIGVPKSSIDNEPPVEYVRMSSGAIISNANALPNANGNKIRITKILKMEINLSPKFFIFKFYKNTWKSNNKKLQFEKFQI